MDAQNKLKQIATPRINGDGLATEDDLIAKTKKFESINEVELIEFDPETHNEDDVYSYKEANIPFYIRKNLEKFIGYFDKEMLSLDFIDYPGLK